MKTRTAFITGATGQDGSYLAELLISKNYEVHGMKRRGSSYNTSRVDHLYNHEENQLSDLKLHYGDMTDSTSISSLIEEIMPDEVYNLAAQSHVKVSFETPIYTANADALGTLRLLEAVNRLNSKKNTRFYQASTSEMFGLTEDLKLNENSVFHPRSPYGVSKLFAHWMTINYREAYGLFASTGILFNHESPRRGETFVTKKIVKAAVKILKGELQTLKLGNLDAIRDWGHAKDYTEGMWLILQHDKPDDWVLATGVACSVRDFTTYVFNKLGENIIWKGSGKDEVGVNDKGKVVIKVDVNYFRPSEVPYLLGDYSKAHRELGWSPKINLDSLITEMINDEISNGKS